MKRALLSTACEIARPQLIAARERQHLSQQEVAEKLGVSKSAVHRWEKKGDVPQPYHIRQLCDLYSMTARDLGFPEFTVDVQTITDGEHAQEPDNDALDAFRRRHVLRRIEVMVWNWSRRNARYHVLQIATLAELKDDNTMDEVMSRRDVLRSLALLPIDMSKLSVRGAVFKSPIEDILAQCAAGIVACWQLRKGDELAFADQTISKYIPTLKAIVQTAPSTQQKAAADLLAQCLLLKSTLARTIATANDALNYAQQAEIFCVTAENHLLHITTLRLKAAAFWYTNQWKRALLAAEQAKSLLEERDRQDKQKQPSVSSQPAKEPIPQLVHSYIYAGLATYQAYDGSREDALLSLKKAHSTFFAQSDNEVVPIWIDHSIGNLLVNDGSTHAHLGLYKGAVDALELIDTRYADDSAIPLSCRLEAVLDQVMAEVSRDDGKRNMQRCIHLWKSGIKGAKTLQSDKKFNEAIQAYKTMQVAWPGEKQVRDLREYIVHW
jgi:transcriptional regulator with XRE-family HTH domain